MSSPLEILEPLPERTSGAGLPAADTRPQPGLLEQAAAQMRVQADTVAELQDERKGAAYRPLIEALVERGLSREYLQRGGDLVAGADVASAAQDFNYDTVFREAKRLGLEGLPANRAEFEKQAFRRGGGRDADQALLARGRGAGATVAQFAGGMAGSFRDPVNIAMLPFGGGGRHLATKILSEAAVNAFGAAVALPGTAHAYEQMGEEFTAGDAALEVAFAAAGGAAVRGGIELAPKIDALGRRAARPVRERFDQFFAESDAARALSRAGIDAADPQTVAAFHILTREEAIDRSSPYARTVAGDTLHRAKIRDADAALASAGGVRRGPGNLNPTILAFFRGKGYSDSQARGITAGIMAESRGGDPAALNPDSHAFGIGQWLGTRKAEMFRRYGSNPSMQQQLEFLHWELQGGDHGGRHVLAHGDEADVLRAYIEKFMRPAAGAETTGDLSRGMAALGRAGEHGPADVGAALDGLTLPEDVPVVRPEALDADRPFVTSAGRQVPIAQLRPSEIDVDAGLMQFKSGGDELGVTDRLHGVQQWDPVAAGLVTVWQPLEGRPLIADGHQRLGLARRIAGAGGDEPVLNAFMLREADGYSASDARIITALKNVGEGTGSATDAAKVLREAGAHFEDLIEKRLPPRSALVRDGKAISRLSDEAFGAVVNEVIPEGHAAAIGHLAPDPDTHLALVELLAKSDPANRRQAEAIVRQALDAGFTKEVQDELFGARDLTNSLFAVKAKLLDKTLGELKRLKGAFGVAARNADALEGAGNTIDVAGSEAAAAANARALGLVEQLALRKGNAVNEILDEAARRISAGEPLARVTRDVVGAIRRLDLGDLERHDLTGAGAGSAGAGDGALGSGRGGLDPREAGATESLAPAERDALEESEDLGPGLFDDPAAPVAKAFDDDAGDGVKAAAESDWHDIRAGVERQQTAPLPPGETRGQGVQYHGARGELPDLQEGYYNPDNIFGGFETFYTTDAVDIAGGYQRKRPNGMIYRVDEVSPVTTFDMEERLPVEEIAALFGIRDWSDATGFPASALEEATSADGRLNLREAMNEIRQQSSGEGYSKDEVQGVFDTAIYNLQQQDFGAMRHVGGLATGRDTHNVKIYFNAKDQLRLVPTSKPATAEAPPAKASAAPAEDRYAMQSRHQSEYLAAQGQLRRGEITAAEFASTVDRHKAERGVTEPVTPLDRGAAVDPAIADRQRQQAQLGAGSPMRAKVEQDGTGGLGLFKVADEPTFDLEDGKGPRTAAEIEAELAAEKAGLEEIRNCLK